MLNSPESHHNTALGASPDASVIAAEEGLIRYIRQNADLSVQGAYSIPADWSHQSQFHLLLTLGRRFTPTPRPEGVVGMPDRLCYSNSAQYATEHPEGGLMYAEGFALTHVGTDFYLPHAWTVRPDGTVLDPTWDDEPGRAYVGIAVADSGLWPLDGGGIIHDFERLMPILRDGFPQNALADRGRPLTSGRPQPADHC
ncbi:hypothetical protein [Streptomyces sp. NPDC059611]|uniref:hypothetical protein n=1 Tax=Streptomyces sp. NPDC059611 TaxID=3346884 RepID=UPI003688FE1D